MILTKKKNDIFQKGRLLTCEAVPFGIVYFSMVNSVRQVMDRPQREKSLHTR